MGLFWVYFGFTFDFLAEGLVFLLWEAVENRKGAVKPRPLCTPLGLFLGVLGLWGCDTVLTFVCMLRYWMWNVVPRLLQWNCNEVLDVRCTSAEFRSLYYATIYPTEIYKVPLGYISAQC